MTDLNSETKEHNNLDELCRMESTCVLPYCGQKINGRYIPQQLLQKGVQIPVPVARTAINRYIRHARFTCHNWCSQHCYWTVFWILFSSLFWTGVAFIAIYEDMYDRYYCSIRNNGQCVDWNYSPRDDTVFKIGVGFVVSYLLLLFLHIGCCIGFRCMLVFFYYDLEPCVKHLAEVLQVQQSYGQPEFDVRRNQIASNHTQTQTTLFEVSARSMLLEHSAKYLQNFIEKDLPDVTSQRHTLQKSCLCQFVQMSLQQTGTGNVLPMMPLQQQYPQHMNDVTVQNV